jgi:hypothetical protein
MFTSSRTYMQVLIGVKHFCLSATITFPYVLPHGECYRPVIS